MTDKILGALPHFTQAHCDVAISSSLPLPVSQLNDFNTFSFK